MKNIKAVVTTLNAKYIHSSLALRLLYVSNRDEHDLSFKEFTIKETPESIANELLDLSAQLIGFGVYIWNVEQTKRVIEILKEKNPNITILLGGPEVTYEPEYFLENWNIDYVISGEGEFVLGDLLTAIEEGQTKITIDSVSSKNNISKVVAQADINKIVQLPSPFMLPEDKEDLKNRMVYFETSRGCPYLCQYCLSSLEKGIRYFPQDYIFENLKYLIDNGAKTIKFLDRTFNMKKSHTMQVFDFMIENYRPNLSCQFEVYADILPTEMIDDLNERLPKDYFRFEIGIQSTHEPTNKAVKRRQNFDLITKNVNKIMEGDKIDLHLDLIAGLPHETFDQFRKSFDDVFALGAKEVQLGFLKMLRGTGLRNMAEHYGYEYDEKAPYQIYSSQDISEAELDRIHRAEDMLERYWNSGRFSETMNQVFEHYYKGNYFLFFDEFANYYALHDFKHFKYQLEDLFRYLQSFLVSKNIDLFSFLRTDYYNNFKVRAHGFWELDIDKELKNQLLYQIGNDKEFLEKHELTRKIVKKQIAIDTLDESNYLLTLFRESIPHKTIIYPKKSFSL